MELPKIILVKTDGYEITGCVYSDQLTREQCEQLGVNPDEELSELLEVEGYMGTTDAELWVYNGKFGLKIEVDQDYLNHAMDEYITFHPQNLDQDVM